MSKYTLLIYASQESINQIVFLYDILIDLFNTKCDD